MRTSDWKVEEGLRNLNKDKGKGKDKEQGQTQKQAQALTEHPTFLIT